MRVLVRGDLAALWCDGVHFILLCSLRTAPNLVPGLAGRIRRAAIGAEKLVGYLHARQRHSAVRRPGRVPAARLTPDEFASSCFDAGGRALSIDQMALQQVGLL